MSFGWSLYVDALVVLAIGGCAWLLFINRKAPGDVAGQGQPLEAEHDGIQELDNPLPAWWTWLFIVTMVFGVVYLVLFPGMGSWAGTLGWTSQGEYEAEMARAHARYGPIFAAYAAQPIPELVTEPQAVEIGERLFLNHCATCHGSDARGARGYPNLSDADWLYGGEPETIITTITAGRVGIMPPMGPLVGGAPGVAAMAQYVISLSGRTHDEAQAKSAAPTFATVCAVCHRADGTGNPAYGAPNLTDDIWLNGGRVEDIELQITHGRTGEMPAHRDLLSTEKIHLLATYVYSLSQERAGSTGRR